MPAFAMCFDRLKSAEAVRVHGQHASVCIVDADPCSLRAMRDAMERAKLHVQTFTSGTDCLGSMARRTAGALSSTLA